MKESKELVVLNLCGRFKKQTTSGIAFTQFETILLKITHADLVDET
jgi:hypothetical protein